MVNTPGPNIPSTLDCSHALHRVLMPMFYFDIFSYPLTFTEIRELAAGPTLSEGELRAQLEQAISSGWIFQQGDYFSCQDRPEWVARRIDNNKRAERYIRHAYRMTHLIRRFPFVRGVFLSGALSKNVMPRDGDIDYFIVTKPGRLWVSRTLLVLFKKVFLLNSHKFFCVNYFVDEDHLTIEEQNQFTATEVATLKPLYGRSMYQKFMATNDWLSLYYPNFPLRETEKTIPHKTSKVQGALEWLLNGQLGEYIDSYFYERTLKYWQRKFANFEADKFSTALKSRPYVSKHHPQDFQNRVLSELEKRIVAFEQQNGVRLERPELKNLSTSIEK